MTTRTRLTIVLITAPVLAFAVVGGLVGKTVSKPETYPHLKVFNEVFSLTTDNYVEPVDVERLMHGAMHGLVESLDADSAYLTAPQAQEQETGKEAGPADIGLDLTRQYYLRVIAARDNSPAARAGLRPGDYVRVIGKQPTRDLSVWEGLRLLRGTAGSTVSLTVLRGNATEAHVVALTREVLPPAPPTSKLVAPGIGYLRVVEFSPTTVATMRSAVAQLEKTGARALVLDLRGTSRGALPLGIDAARLFVASGTIAQLDARGASRQTITATAGDGLIALPLAVLTDYGTAGAAELFTAAITGNKRGETIGERTSGRAAQQKLFPLPDGAGLWMSYSWYLTPAGTPIHERGLQPEVAIVQPDPEFGAVPPPGDQTLDKAVERLKARLTA
jgi:carboxyl-terminal processing protease